MISWFKKNKEEESLLKDLLSLQINTIVRNRITGSGMPADTDEAFKDIIVAYELKIDQHLNSKAIKSLQQAVADAKEPDKQILMFNENLAKCDFKRCFQYLEAAAIALKKQVHPENVESILSRIARFAGDLAQFAEAGKTPDKDDLALLRKCWELGTEQIAMQTVVHISGDVFTRVSPAFTGPGKEDLFRIHQVGLNTSVQYWQNIVKTVSQFARSLFKK